MIIIIIKSELTVKLLKRHGLANLDQLCAVNPELRTGQLEVVDGRHALAVGACVKDHQTVTLCRGWQLTVFAQEVCALAHWANHVPHLLLCVSLLCQLDVLVGIVEAGTDQLRHGAVDHDEVLGAVRLVSGHSRDQHCRVAYDRPARFDDQLQLHVCHVVPDLIEQVHRTKGLLSLALVVNSETTSKVEELKVKTFTPDLLNKLKHDCRCISENSYFFDC